MWPMILGDLGMGSVCVYSRRTFLWSPDIPKWHHSHNFVQKNERHILSALLRTTLQSLMGQCRCVNVELKTIKTTFWDKETFEATEVQSTYLKVRGEMFGSCQSLCVLFFFFLQLYDFAIYFLIQRAPEHVNNGKSGGYFCLVYQSFKWERHLREEFTLLCNLFFFISQDN